MVTCAECSKVLIAEMCSYFTQDRRFHFCDAYCSNAWYRTHESNGELKQFDDDSLMNIAYRNKEE